MIKTVIRTPNDMVVVFNGRREQMPEYQGRYEEVREKILRDAPPEAIFGHDIYGRGETTLILREKW